MDERITCPRCGGLGYLTAASATVGDMIQQRRVHANLSQMELANRVGVSRPQIGNIESGRHDPPVSKLRAYAEALGCSIKDLIP